MCTGCWPDFDPATDECCLPSAVVAKRAYVPSRRCSRIKQNGEQCRRAAINGGKVCVVHGGNAPTVKRAARRNLIREGFLDEGTAYTVDGAELEPVAGLAAAAGAHRRVAELIGARIEDELADTTTEPERLADLAAIWSKASADYTKLCEQLARLGIDANSKPAFTINVAWQVEIAVLMTALAPFPEARLAAAEALALIDGEVIEQG